MKIAGLSFDHMHMGDLLRQAHEYPDAHIVGIADDNAINADTVKTAQTNFGLSNQQVFSDYRECLETLQPELVILCPAIARHAEMVELVAPYGANILVEKPFAISLQEADRMIEAAQKHNVKMCINWPLAWYPSHNTARRLIAEGTIGDLIEVHYYDGNRGPLHHLADKIEVSPEEVARKKNESWFYQKEAGGGSLIDYLGYGATLGTWFFDGAAPSEVTAMTFNPPSLEVDEHSITICNYGRGLSKFETRWGTFTDPWTHQPQPKCGFVLKGTRGTIASYDYESTVRVQTVEKPDGFEVPVDTLQSPNSAAIEHFIAHIRGEVTLHPCLDPQICRVGQQIVDTALASARQKRTSQLLG